MNNDYPFNVFNYPSHASDIESSKDGFIFNQIGIDNIELIAKYETFKKMAEKMGLEIEAMPKPKTEETDPKKNIFKRIDYEMKQDSKTRFQLDKFVSIVERLKLPKVKGMSKALYITIIRNIPILFDVATHHKKAKDTFCLILFAGLHQPSKKISSEAMEIISKFIKRKAFKFYSLDIAIDTTDDKSIDYKRKGAFKDDLMPYSKHDVISKGSSLYINDLDHPSISRILYYDKYKKQLDLQKKEIIGNDLRAWKRLEITLTYDVTQSYNKGFIHYIEGLNFIDDLYEVADFAKLTGVQGYSNDYLTYQLNSLIDNRFMNNYESKKQFNSVESLERFKQSDFRRYTIPM
ncbi:hypothetical protein MNB_SV-14-1735 [hydrothermal vent metagenome]|uniref:Uncharacterized protein n=1 Tax=hydrothermal vent metagenome TaxID=652676 RepID=A0A1W1CSH3_9ZZZZ